MGTKRAGFAMVLVFVTYFVQSANTPMLNTYLDEEGYRPIMLGIGFAIVCVCYTLSMPCIEIFKVRVTKRGIMVLGLFLQAIGMFITGIEQVKSFHNPGAFALLGMIIYGFGLGMVTIPVMPEILEGIEVEYDNDFNDQLLYNHVSGFFIMSQAVGETCGPLTQALVELTLDFRPTQEIFVSLLVVFTLIYTWQVGSKQFWNPNDKA